MIFGRIGNGESQPRMETIHLQSSTLSAFPASYKNGIVDVISQYVIGELVRLFDSYPSHLLVILQNHIIEMLLKFFLGLATRIRRHESVLSLELRAHLIGLVYCHWIGSSVVYDSLQSWISRMENFERGFKSFPGL